MRRIPGKVVAAAAALATALAAHGAPPLDGRVTYRVHGAARITGAPVLDPEMEIHADAVLEPGAGRDVRARFASLGHACELIGRIDPRGVLSFRPGQRCVVDVREPEVRGSVALVLRTGGGRIDGEVLSLDLSFDVSGDLALGTGGAFLPPMPVEGEGRAIAEGRRDRSRAAQ